MGSFSRKTQVNSVAKRGFPLKCVCGGEARIYISETQDNPGRPFYRCAKKKYDHLFKWVEEAVLEEVEDAIPKLGNIESEVYNLKSEFEGLKDLVDNMKEELVSMRTESTKWKTINKVLCVCVCLMFIAIMCILY